MCDNRSQEDNDYSQAVSAHLQAMLEGTKRFFERNNIEVNLDEISATIEAMGPYPAPARQSQPRPVRRGPLFMARTGLTRLPLLFPLDRHLLPAIEESKDEEFSVEQLCHVFEGGPEYDASQNCGICLCELGEMHTAKHVELTCRHRYHSACIIDWLREKRNCPVCRQDVRVQ